MRIVADENVQRPLVMALRARGHEVVFITELAPGLRDGEVLQPAAQANALLLTRDSDFWQLVFEAHRPCSGVLLERLSDRRARDKIEPAVNALETHGERLYQAFSTLTPEGLTMESLVKDKQ